MQKKYLRTQQKLQASKDTPSTVLDIVGLLKSQKKTGGNIVEICKVTDHDDPRNALIYVHIALQDMRKLMGKK